jgi:hypothetical protein
MLGVLHTRAGGWINRLDNTPNRKVWHNFWDTKLTYEKSYLARLNYVHQNPVRHGLVRLANHTSGAQPDGSKALHHRRWSNRFTGSRWMR